MKSVKERSHNRATIIVSKLCSTSRATTASTAIFFIVLLVIGHRVCSFTAINFSFSPTKKSPLNIITSDQGAQTSLWGVRYIKLTDLYRARRPLSSSSEDNAEGQYSYTYAITEETFESEAATNVLNAILYPASEKKARYDAGITAQQLKPGEALTPSDPRLSFTYTEFPLHSFDKLVERANELRLKSVAETEASMITRKVKDISAKKRSKLVDLGSGTGRLVLYGALTKGGTSGWDVHGIEISSELHYVGRDILERATQRKIFCEPENKKYAGASGENVVANGTVCLHLGSAKECASRGVLDDADIVFCYSTVLSAPSFCIDWGAPMLGSDWSALLSAYCPKGCLVVTTDRVLNPIDGWILLDKMEVNNPDLFGSVGYIHLLDRREE